MGTALLHRTYKEICMWQELKPCSKLTEGLNYLIIYHGNVQRRESHAAVPSHVIVVHTVQVVLAHGEHVLRHISYDVFREDWQIRVVSSIDGRVGGGANGVVKETLLFRDMPC